MPQGRLARRIVVGSVAVFATPALLVTLAGCQRLSVARNDPTTLPPLAPSAATAALAGPVPSPGTLDSLDRDREHERARPLAAFRVKSSPTPLLDAALARAETPRREESTSPSNPAGPREPSLAPPSASAGLIDLPPLAPTTATGAANATETAETLKVSATSALAKPATEPAIPLKPINPDRPLKPAPASPAPAEEWRQAVEHLRHLVRERKGAPGDLPEVWALRSRLLDWLTESGEGSDTGALWRSVVPVLGAESVTRDEEIRRAVRVLEDQSPLEIADLRLCRKVNGFGSFETIDPTACKAGQAVIVYCEMSGLHDEPAGESFRSRLSSQVELRAGGEREPVWKQSLGTADDLCRRRRRDYYVCYRFNLPENLAPGSYSLHLKQEDLVAGRSVSLALSLTIQP